MKNFFRSIFLRGKFLEKCENCKEPIDNYEFYRLFKYKSGTENIVDSKNFCSKDCLENFYEDKKTESKYYKKEKVNRCVSYYDCEELDNLRRLCEKKEQVDQIEDAYLYNYPLLIGVNFCEPADAGLIKSAVLLHRESKKQFIRNSIFTGIIIILTLLNLWMMIRSSTLQEKVINQLGNKENVN
jgi:hypothetical protein